MDRMYVERAGGRWSAWTYIENGKFYFSNLYTMQEIERYAKKHHYKLIVVA